MPSSDRAWRFLDVSEYHTPEFHSVVRVSAEGTVTLPMIGEVTTLGHGRAGSRSRH
jgi:protein involved in polysaccharide export with SLBB domain